MHKGNGTVADHGGCLPKALFAEHTYGNWLESCLSFVGQRRTVVGGWQCAVHIDRVEVGMNIVAYALSETSPLPQSVGCFSVWSERCYPCGSSMAP